MPVKIPVSTVGITSGIFPKNSQQEVAGYKVFLCPYTSKWWWCKTGTTVQ